MSIFKLWNDDLESVSIALKEYEEQEEKDRQNARKAEPKSRLLKIVSPKLYLALKDMGKLEKML